MTTELLQKRKQHPRKRYDDINVWTGRSMAESQLNGKIKDVMVKVGIFVYPKPCRYTKGRQSKANKFLIL